jgi:hypothetical protein
MWITSPSLRNSENRQLFVDEPTVNISLTTAKRRYAVAVPPKSPLKRIHAALDALGQADDPLSRVNAARLLREATDELEITHIEAARKAGITWTEIGAGYGLTKQGAQQRFRSVPRRGKEMASKANRGKPD